MADFINIHSTKSINKYIKLNYRDNHQQLKENECNMRFAVITCNVSTAMFNLINSSCIISHVHCRS